MAQPSFPLPESSAISLVSMSEIAAMAQVQRSVVPTWRRRHSGFPTAAFENAGRPWFDGREVVEWLLATGLGNADPAHLRAELALHVISGHKHLFGPRRLVEIVGSLLCLRHLDQKPLVSDKEDDKQINVNEAWAALQNRAERMDPEDEFVLRELRAADSSAVVLAHLAEDLVEAAYTTGSAYERLLGLRARLELTELTAEAVTPGLRDLLVQLADPRSMVERREQITVADPHARTGDLLAAIVHAVDDPATICALAAEPDGPLARLVRRRLLLAGVEELKLDVQIGLDLEERLADPDLIITQLPYQAAEKRSKFVALVGIEKVADLLGPGRTALVLGPADALVDVLPDTQEAQLRSSLLRSGVVEAVIDLPGGMTPYRPGYRLALWVLTRDPVTAARGYVLLADVSAEPLNEQVRTRLVEDVLIWRAEGRHARHDPRYGHVVSIAQLDAKFGGPLAPPGPPASQTLSRTVTERPALIAEAEGRLQRAGEQAQRYADEHGRTRINVVRRTGRMPTPTTVRALIAGRRVMKVSGHRLAPEHIVPDGHHNVLGPEEIGGGPVGARRIDRAVLATYGNAAFTEPGDIVYTTSPQLGLMVDHDGFSVVAFPARILRIVPNAERPLAPRVLAALLGAARNTGRSPGAVRAARPIEDFVVPDLDPADMRRADAFLADIERRQGLLHNQDDTLTEIRRLAVAGLADGTLTIDDP
ncbi:hypothetical protein [Nonomuraea sp. JJY05]|uniref:hypothetical protein n=1 Tax=Nonomuraea sp. JJY05 TaxID=3350255 RepID=UPI00373FB633